MMRLKAWLLRWLGAASSAVADAQTEVFNEKLQELKRDHEREIAELKKQHDADISSLKADVEAAVAEVISELNTLRNSAPAAQHVQPPVRVFRNFREFRTAIEGRPPQIPIERTS